MNELDELFEVFWNAGMRKVNKKKAKQVFTKTIKNQIYSSPEAFTELFVSDIERRIELNQYGFNAMHPTTYLNGERWEDDYPEGNTHKQSNQTHSQRQHEQAADAYKQMELEHTESNSGIICPLQ
jgi:hypothetical protein